MHCNLMGGRKGVKQEFLVFAVVIHVGLVEAEFTGIFLFEGQSRGHHFGGHA